MDDAPLRVRRAGPDPAVAEGLATSSCGRFSNEAEVLEVTSAVSAIEVQTISPDQRDKILSLEEGHFLDMKAIEIAPGKLSRTLAAFADAAGGDLYVGIDEVKSGATKTRVWRGFPDQEAANGHLQVFERLFPLGEWFAYGFLRCPGESGLVLRIQVFKTPDVKFASDGTPYLRRGAQSLPADSPEQLHRLQIDKGITSFESETVSTDLEFITRSAILERFLLDVVPSAEPAAWLKSQQLLRSGRPTVAAVLLFAESPQAILPKRCGLKIVRYESRETSGSRAKLSSEPITIEGHLYQQIRTPSSASPRSSQPSRSWMPKGSRR